MNTQIIDTIIVNTLIINTIDTHAIDTHTNLDINLILDIQPEHINNEQEPIFL